MIVILNDDGLKLSDYMTKARKDPQARVYRLPERHSLASCLNFGVRQARYDRIAKFDDDDYYGPEYLADSLRTMQRSGADIVGKRAHYMYLEGAKVLLFRYPDQENRKVSLVQGATLLVKRHVFGRVGFRGRDQGECVRFCIDSRKSGFTVYAGSRRHFAAFRRKNAKGHTWKASDRLLLSRNAKVLRVRDVRAFVSE